MGLLRVFHRVCGVPVVPQHEVFDDDGRFVARGDLWTQWHRRGYTSVDLLHRPEGILRDADQTLGRRHRVDRMDPWLRMLEESLFHEAGRARFAARLTGPGSGRPLHRHAG